MPSARIDWNDRATRERLTLLAQVARAIKSAVLITDTQGIAVWVNEGFTRITGYGFDEAVGRHPGRLLQGPDTDRDEVARIGAALRARQSIAAELVNYAKDGRRYWVGMRIDPLLDADGEFEGFIASEADITERNKERQTLEESTRRFNMATRAARVGVFERDTNFEVLWWSETMWQLFGQDPATFVPSNEAWLQLIHPQDRDRIRTESIHLTQSRGGINLQYRMILPDGEIRHFQSIGAPTEPTGGAVERIGGVTFDVTERVKAEEREQTLQHRLRESSHQAGMAEIASGALHNVGNILNSLGTANITARRGLKGLRLERLDQATALLRDNRNTLAAFLTDDERGRQLPDYLPALSAHMSASSLLIKAELETTEKLLHHLRDVVSAQQELARFGGRHEWLRMDELVETALLVQASELAQTEIEREYADLPPVLADRHKVLMIVVNLISNARDAVQTGAPGRCRIQVKLALDGDHVRLEVADSGIGMSAEVLAQLWRFGFTTKKNGHGFGLHNSANTAHEMGATLTAHSDGIGRGSCFTLRLPIDKPDAMLSSGAAVAAEPAPTRASAPPALELTRGSP